MADNKKMTLKQELSLITDKMINGVRPTNETKYAVQKNLIRLEEMRVKNETLFNKIIDSKNKKTTFLTLINNSSIGLELGTDFYFVDYKGSIGEIKNGRGWKLIGKRFSIDPIEFMKVFVLTKYDDYEIGWDNQKYANNLLKYRKGYDDAFKIKFEDINEVFAIVRFKNGVERTRITTKKELEAIRDASPSKSSSLSPWTIYPLSMVLTKMYRDLVKHEVDLDTNKMARAGYKMLEDDVPIQSYEAKEDENTIILDNDFKETNAKPIELTLLDKVIFEIEEENEEVINRAKELTDKKQIEDISLLNKIELEYVLNGDNKNVK